MEKIQKIYEVYNFDELDEEIQEQLIEEEKQVQYEAYTETCLFEDMEEQAKILLQKYFRNKAEYKSINYSLTWSQGDGAMIEFDLYYYNKYVKIRHNDNFYCHARTFSIDTWELTDKQEEQLKNKIIQMNEEFEKIGWKLVSWDPEKELCIDYLKEHKYLKNGEVFE